MKFKSYVLTIPLGEKNCDYKPPTALLVILGRFKASVGVTIKVWVSNILLFLVSIRKGIQLLKLLTVLLFHHGVNNAWGRYTPKYLAGDIKAGIKGQASKNSETAT